MPLHVAMLCHASYLCHAHGCTLLLGMRTMHIMHAQYPCHSHRHHCRHPYHTMHAHSYYACTVFILCMHIMHTYIQGMCAHMHVCRCVCTYVCMYACTHVGVYIYIYIYIERERDVVCLSVFLCLFRRFALSCTIYIVFVTSLSGCVSLNIM